MVTVSRPTFVQGMESILEDAGIMALHWQAPNARGTLIGQETKSSLRAAMAQTTGCADGAGGANGEDEG